MNAHAHLILGTGAMAHAHAEAYRSREGFQLVAAVDVDPSRAQAFAGRFGIERTFNSIEAALEWGAFDTVSNTTPDDSHYPTTLPLLSEGKAVLCEKPLATNYGQARTMADLATRKGVVNMINLSYRRVPALVGAARRIAAGEIGEVRHFEASYLQSWLTQGAWGDWQSEATWLWRLSSAHGSTGVLGDVGIHILDFLTHAIGSDVDALSCRLRTFDKAPGGQIGEYVLDANDSAVMHLTLQNGAMGVLHASRFATGHHNDLQARIWGTKGGLDIRFEKDESVLAICRGSDAETARWRRIRTGSVPTIYDHFAAAVDGAPSEGPDFQRGAALQRVLDTAFASDAAGGSVMVVPQGS